MRLARTLALPRTCVLLLIILVLMRQPSLSIVLPNFNNGLESSRDGQTSFLRQALDSFFDTLDGFEDWELIVLDDGSTDSSRDDVIALQERDPRIKVILHDKNSGGHIAAVMNELVRASTAPIILKVDGDITFRTLGWPVKLLEAFAVFPDDAGILGAMQFRPQGDVQGCGDFWLHPKGYHHYGKGMPPDSLRTPIEADTVMACFMAFRREVWERSAFDESFIGRGADEVHFELNARRAGFRIWALPSIEFVHHHSQRASRSAAWDASAADRLERELLKRWGFGYHPDIAELRELLAGSPLLWNPAWFDPNLREMLPPGPFECFDEVAKSDPDGVAALVNRLRAELLTEGADAAARVLVAGSGDAGLARRLNEAGYTVTNAPLGGKIQLPYHDNSFDGAVLPVCLDRCLRPGVILRETARAVKPGGAILILCTHRQLPGVGDPIHHYIEFSPYELNAFCMRQVNLKRFSALGPYLLGIATPISA